VLIVVVVIAVITPSSSSLSSPSSLPMDSEVGVAVGLGAVVMGVVSAREAMATSTPPVHRTKGRHKEAGNSDDIHKDG
jgi:hypothetical protein